jgi:hypothetical protein
MNRDEYITREGLAGLLAWVNWRNGYMAGKADLSEVGYTTTDALRALAAVMDNRPKDALRLYVEIRARPENKGDGDIRKAWRATYRYVRANRLEWVSQLVWSVCWRSYR